MKILMIGFNVQEDIFPLGLSYLKNYALKFHPEINFKIKEFAFGTRFDYDTNAILELQVLSYILLEKPDLVCFSCYIWNSRIIRNICQTLKKVSKIKIALGGVEVDESFKEDVDYLIKGEGEIRFKELLDTLENGQQWYNKEEKLIDDLDEIPFPYRNNVGKKDYKVVRIETTRGCPYKCKYCHYAERKFREFSLAYLKENIAYLFENYQFKHLTILDANFNVNKKRMCEILRIISTHSQKVKINFELKPELIDEEVIQIIKDSGLKINCELGLQSVDEEVLETCGRSSNLEKVKQGLKLLNKARIKYKIDLMYGLPGDNFFKFLRTVNFIMKYSQQKNLSAHHFMVLNNTKFRDHMRFLKDSSSMIIKTDTQGVVDFYKEKLFIDMINEK